MPTEATSPEKDPIVNCHTHIFTGSHVPPYLAKTFVPWPLYSLLNIHWILWIAKKLYRKIDEEKYKPNSFSNRMKRLLNSQTFLGFVLNIFKLIVTINALYIIVGWFPALQPIPKGLLDWYKKAVDFLDSYRIIWTEISLPTQLVILLFVVVFLQSGRRLIFSLFKPLIGKQTLSMIERYLLLAQYAIRYGTQDGIFTALRNQYPPKTTKFVTLPMDMEFMGAGRVPTAYAKQMEELADIKNKPKGAQMKPFLFVDPRRIRTQQDFFGYTQKDGVVTLSQGTMVKEYLEDKKFCGIKIYPALGYYPFDRDLLPLWKYAADNEVPIMTHCIPGTIFYRGKKKKAWNKHPVFKEADGNQGNKPLALPERKNINFTVNFTHPLNYLCLVHEPLLRILVGDSDTEIKELFGYTDDNTKLKRDLTHLKICLAHFGGEEEWVRYLEADRSNYAQDLIMNRQKGLDFDMTGYSVKQWNALSAKWKYADWYSIICSLIIQYPNMYTDISYILSKPRILPLLKETLDQKLNPHLSQRVLFGTDFYVVRNHFSEKDMLAQMKAGLSEEEFDLIARQNPKTYLDSWCKE